MSFSKVHSAQANLLKAGIIDIETDLGKGLHAFAVVGLPDKAVEESRDRISAAIKNSGFTSPKSQNQKIVVSLAPADIKKEGPNFDLAMALGYLLAADEIRFKPEEKIFLGELSLDGELRPITGTLLLTREAARLGFKEIFVPKKNAREAALVDGVTIFGASTLDEVVKHLDEKNSDKENLTQKISPQEKTVMKPGADEIEVDLSDVRGQESAKRGLEIAAAGGHNIAMYGPPGTGKTMLAKAFSHLLPPLSFEEALEVTGIHSIAGVLRDDLIMKPPLRAPHHSASYVSIVGGGSTPKPGEITLAHRGILFLDEFPEFERRVIDSLRQPLEDREVTVSRIKGTAHFPAHFTLIAAMNPCPCGNFGIRGKNCTCSGISIRRYQQRISGPIIDRVDMWVEVSAVDHKELMNKTKSGETTEVVRKRVLKAMEIQSKRFTGTNIKRNGDMRAKDILKFIEIEPNAKEMLDRSAASLNLSGRAYHKIIKLSRTIADLANAKTIENDHILEAIQYRPKQQVV